MLDVAQIRAATSSRTPEVVTGGHQRAAVAMIVRDGADGAEVLLIRRAERPGDPWSGHMGLPGGRWEPGDATLEATATRETREEVGLDLTRAGSLLGSLSTIPAVARGRPTRLTITPYLFVVAGDPTLQPNEEVAQVLWAQLGSFRDQRHAASVEYEIAGRLRRLPAWNVHGQVVWGLTYAMLSSLLAAVR